MLFHKTAINLIIVDFESVAIDIVNSNLNWLKDWGLFTDDLNSKEGNRLLLFHTLTAIHTVWDKFSDKKNVVFYINERAKIDQNIIRCINTLAEYFPILIYRNNIDFSCLNNACGEAVELLIGIQNYRYNFNFVQYRPQIEGEFYSKFHITPGIKPATL